MLKIYNKKVKIIGSAFCLCLLSISYIGLNFYSIPEKVSAATEIEEWRRIEDISIMQEMTTEICNNTDVGYGKKLQDVRDGSEYYVQKLTDNNCWMLQNLKLTREGITSWKASNPDDDNNVQLSSRYSNVASDSTFSMPTTISSLASTDFSNSNYFRAQVYNPSETANSRQKGYGAYYSWFAATAGTGDASVAVGGQDVDASICPKGWRLPTSNKTSATATGYNYSFNKLVIDPLTGAPYAMSDDANYKANAWKSANYTNTLLGLTNAAGAVFSNGFFPAAGYVASGSLNGVGSEGYYWSSTAGSSTHAYDLYFYSSVVNTSDTSYRYNGISVRCVANPAIHSDPVPPTDERHTDVAVHVGPTISIDAVTSLYGEVDYTKVLEDNITATVSSNNPYKLLLSTSQTSLLDATQPDNTGIPPVATTEATPALPITAGTSAWGIYNGLDSDNTTKLYKAITTTPKIYYNTTVPTEDKLSTIHSFGIGIAVSPSIPNGTYSTSVTVTAVNT